MVSAGDEMRRILLRKECLSRDLNEGEGARQMPGQSGSRGRNLLGLCEDQQERPQNKQEEQLWGSDP